MACGCGKATFSVLSSTVVLLAIFYQLNDHFQELRLRNVLGGLLRAEKKVPVEKTKVGIGFGGCLDVFLPFNSAFKQIGLTSSGIQQHHDTVDSAEELEELFNYFFYHGAAAERYVSNASFFQELIRGAQAVVDARWDTGGNAPVMAARLAKEGCDILLGARKSPNITFHPHVRALDVQDSDDIHIIYEYDRGDSWGNITSPRANRLIVHNDNFNPMLTVLADFKKEMLIFDPKLFVLGGLQMMDNFPFPEGVRASKLSELKDFLQTIPRSTLTHFEMASFTEQSLIEELIHKVLPYTDSLGMNEQELPNLLGILKSEDVKLVSDSNPRVATTLDQIRELYDIIKSKQIKGSRTLSRIHIHTLAYQAVVTLQGSVWKNTMSAAAKASLVANRHVCGNSSIDLEKARLILDESFSASVTEGSERIYLEDNRPVSCWEEGRLLFCVAPNLVCTDIYQTGGGGDNISAAGLSVQI